MTEQKRIDRLINKAADLIGTDPSLRCFECIEIAIDHGIKLRKELYQARKVIIKLQEGKK
jgi:hypothetical protein